MRKYILDGMGSALLAIVNPSRQAPRPKAAPMQNRPAQSITTVPFPVDIIDYSHAGPVLDYVAQLRSLEVVAVTPHFQPGFIPRAPHTPVGPKTVGITDSRLMRTYPNDGARESYDNGQKQAPAHLQSVPGYTVKQTVITKSSPGYPKTALRAPAPRGGGGVCDG